MSVMPRLLEVPVFVLVYATGWCGLEGMSPTIGWLSGSRDALLTGRYNGIVVWVGVVWCVACFLCAYVRIPFRWIIRMTALSACIVVWTVGFLAYQEGRFTSVSPSRVAVRGHTYAAKAMVTAVNCGLVAGLTAALLISRPRRPRPT